MSVFTLHYRSAPAHAAPSLFQRASASLRRTIATYRTQNLLAQLDDRMLSDIGVTRAQAGYPVDQPIWDAGLR